MRWQHNGRAYEEGITCEMRQSSGHVNRHTRANAGADIDVHVFRCVLHGDACRYLRDVSVTMRIWAPLL
jgi:hypothetical protein